ncbi:MAG TPA: 4Fe-4S binding protein [Leptolinea sp.]
MTYLITDDCIMCGSCEPFCDKGAIIESNDKYVIDLGKCGGCGVCTEYCPIDGAIIEIPERILQ